MNLPIRIEAGSHWDFKGQTLIFQQELGDGLIYFMRAANGGPFQLETAGAPCWPSTTWFLEKFAAGDLRQKVKSHAGKASANRSTLDEDLEALQQLDAKARLRAFVLRNLDALGGVPLSDKTIALALNQIWNEQPDHAASFPAKPATRSVRRWLKDRGLPGERRIADLVARSGRMRRQRQFPVVTIRLMQRYGAWYWTRLGLSFTDAYARFTKVLEYINRRRCRGVLEPLSRPTFETFRKETRALERYETYAQKYGAKKARTRFKACGLGLSATRSLRLGCMDHTVLDGVAVIDPDWMLPVGRPYLTTLIDVRSRCMVGFVLSFEPPSIYSVMECIKRANRPKQVQTALSSSYPVLDRIFGRFDEIVVDNGKEFVGTSLEDAMGDVGTTVRFAPVASPQHKAIVERFFRTLNQLLNTKLPGATFKAELLREMGYDPSKDAVLTINQLERLIHEAIAVYHVSYHKGARGIPAHLWQQDMDAHRISIIGDDRRLDQMMGAVEASRSVTTSGISLFGLRYHDQAKVNGLLEDLIAFQPVRGQRKGSATVSVKVKYNPANLTEVHAWNRRRNTYVTLPCADERYASGISLWHHRKLGEWARNKSLEFNTETDRLLARAQLMEEIEAAAPHLKGAARAAMRRILTGAKVEQPHASGVTIAYAPSRHDGMAPVIEHELLADSRTDQGQTPIRPPRPKKSKSPRYRKPSRSPKPRPLPETGLLADFTPDHTDWKEIEL